MWYLGGGAELSNSCWASHLLQVESSANRQTGTNPLRQAPGRPRDGQRKSGSEGGDKAKAKRRWDEKDTIKEMEGGKRWKGDGSAAEEQMELLQPVTVSPNGGDGVGWGRLVHGFAGKEELKSLVFSFSPYIYPLLWHPPFISLPSLAFFLFSETDRTREACESKDERPVREVCVCVSVCGRWMNDPSYPQSPTGAILL